MFQVKFFNNKKIIKKTATNIERENRSSGTVWETRWTSWASFPFLLVRTDLCGRQATLKGKRRNLPHRFHQFQINVAFMLLFRYSVLYCLTEISVCLKKTTFCGF